MVLINKFASLLGMKWKKRFGFECTVKVIWKRIKNFQKEPEFESLLNVKKFVNEVVLYFKLLWEWFEKIWNIKLINLLILIKSCIWN